LEQHEDWRRLAGGAAVLVLAVFAVYWPALRGQFLWDDFLVVHRNPLVTGELAPGAIWFRMEFPLTCAAFWLEWLAWGNHPAGYHVVNVLLHATGAVLLWRVLARLRVPASWLAAMLFAVQPMCVESVAWISELKNTLSLPFFLLSLLWYLRSDSQFHGHQPSTINNQLPCYWLSLGAFVLALLSKTSTVMLPVVLLGCAWWQRGRITWRDWSRTSPFFLIALAFGLMGIWLQAHCSISGATVQSENFWGRLAGAGMALWFYLGKALLPLNLCMIYPQWKIDALAFGSYLPLLLWCGVLAVCWGFRRNWGRHVLFGLGCFTVTLFPVLGFFDMFYLTLSRVVDHFAYLPLTALVALAAGGLDWTLRGRGLGVVGGGLVVGLAVLSVLRAQVFVSEEALWRDTLAKNPAAWCAHANLGWILASQQKYDEARQHLEASLVVKPDNARAHSNLGRVLSLQGQFAEAEPQFQAALRLKPNDADIRESYASTLAEQGRQQEAVTQLREALRLRPDTDARLQLATLLYQLRKFPEAVAEYRQLLATKPNQPEALNNLAWLLATCPDPTLRDGPDAVRLAERACRLSGFKQPRELSALAAAYAEAGRFPDAVAAAQKAIDAARANGNAQLAAVGQQLLNLYRAGKPYHMPPPE
jgi:tetratricopeptide (TPR) repeat protein